MRADRLLLLVSLLRHRGRLTAAELATELEVDRRTVLRDIEALSAAGFPVYAERGRHGGFALLPGFTPDATELSAAEAAALFVAGGGQTLTRLGLDAPLASALRKLGTGLPAHVRTEVDRTGERLVVDPDGWTARPADSTEMNQVQQAVFTDRRLRFAYVPRPPRIAGVRTVDPYGLLLAGSTWYLIAAHRGQPRSYRVSRMASVTVLDTPSSRPDDLDLRALWQQMRNAYTANPGTMITIKVPLRWSEMVLTGLSSQLSRTPELRTDGDFMIITASTQMLRGVAGALAGFGAMVEVLDPPELQVILADVGLELVDCYRQQTAAAATDVH